MRNIKYIVLHHSATEAGTSERSEVDAIMANHRKQWVSEFPNYVCDYHYIVGRNGTVYVGQPEEAVGWHATNYTVNLESLGVCFLGNFEKDIMSKPQFDGGVNLLRRLKDKYGIKSDNILRHKDIVSDRTGRKFSTLCPGRNFPFEELLTSIFSPFKDIDDAYPYIKEVLKLNQFGVVLGDSMYLRPKDYLTREEGFLIAYRILKLIKGDLL